VRSMQAWRSARVDARERRGMAERCCNRCFLAQSGLQPFEVHACFASTRSCVLHPGSSVAGCEMGYMLGVVYALKGEVARDADLVTSRQLHIAEEILEMIDNCPDDVEGSELQEYLLKVRNRFKLLTASVPAIQKVRKPVAMATSLEF
jgi:hypothetical protein